MDIYMVVSGRGGVGRTTLAAGLSAAFAHRGEKSLVIELDSGFGQLSWALGLEDVTAMDLSDLLCGRCELQDVLLRHARSRIEFIPAAGSVDFRPAEQQLRELAQMLREAGCTRVFLDCPAGFSELHRAACAVADMALMVTLPERPSARNAGVVAAQIAAAGVAEQGLIINRVTRAVPEAAGVYDLDEAIDLAGVQLIGVIPQHKKPTRLHLWEDGASTAVENTAARIAGERIPLLPMFL